MLGKENSEISRIWHRIEAAEKTAGRPLGSVTLIAAAKGQPVERILPLLALGLRDIGENRVQEASAKQEALRAAYPELRWHLIGPLQSNKAGEAAALFDVVHSIDRPKIAQALAQACDRLGKRLSCFVQVNIGREPQKSGVAPQELPALLAELRRLPALEPVGLMAVPPADQPPAPYLALLAELARREGLSGLSMGMSGDFETAIRLGATHVRIGTALFGERPPPGMD